MANKTDVIVVGPFQVNCYLVWEDSTGEGVIIDPGDEADLIFQRAAGHDITPKAILLTHGHVDHIAAVGEVRQKYDIPLYVGREDASMLANPSSNASAYLSDPIVVPEPDVLLDDEQLISFGTLSFRVLATPGHTPGGVCFFDESPGILYCGDTLFQMSIGRTDLPGGSTDQLLESINSKIMTLPDSVVCYPGHGPWTTVGAERNGNPFLTGGFFA